MRAVLIALLVIPAAAVAQEQQAGNEASRNAEQTFQELVERCDNTDILTRRARIRVQLSLVDEETRSTVENKIDEAFATCGEGNIEQAVATLDEAAGMTAASVETTTQTMGAEDDEPAQEAAAEPQQEGEEKPWWRFW